MCLQPRGATIRLLRPRAAFRLSRPSTSFRLFRLIRLVISCQLRAAFLRLGGLLLPLRSLRPLRRLRLSALIALQNLRLRTLIALQRRRLVRGA